MVNEIDTIFYLQVAAHGRIRCGSVSRLHPLQRLQRMSVLERPLPILWLIPEHATGSSHDLLLMYWAYCTRLCRCLSRLWLLYQKVAHFSPCPLTTTVWLIGLWGGCSRLLDNPSCGQWAAIALNQWWDWMEATCLWVLRYFWFLRGVTD